jgi:hypothetical protein
MDRVIGVRVCIGLRISYISLSNEHAHDDDDDGDDYDL